MKKLVDLVKLDRLDGLIRRAATGSPEELAKRLGMSRSSLFEFIAYLKEEMRAPIIYNAARPSYMYSYTPKFYLGFEMENDENLASRELNETYGGELSTNPGNTTSIQEVTTEQGRAKRKIEIEIDEDEFILDADIDFSDLYH